MKKVYRFEDTRSYWDRRWKEAGRDLDSFTDMSIYPAKYAQMVMDDPRASVLEIGCGLGRVLKHYHRLGFQICGIERSHVAVDALLADDPTLKVQVGDALELPYGEEQFDTVMAFGVYHNLEEGMEQALAQAAHCLKPDGRFCISMRPDNLEMRLNERYWGWKQRGRGSDQRRFHRWLVRNGEFQNMLGRCELNTTAVHYARNVSLLWRLPFFRANQRTGNESQRRAEGYRLNAFGRLIDGFLMTAFPSQMCNVMVFIGRKQGTESVNGH